MMYNPENWYWIKEDGTVFSSAAQALIEAGDEGYATFVAAGGRATPYPRDLTGAESEAELAAVLSPYGIYVRLTDYAAAKRFALETGGFTYQGHLIATDRDSQSKIGNGALAANIVGSSFTTKWKCSDGSFLPLDQAGMVAMATAVMNFVNDCFAVESTVDASIAAGTIKSQADVNSASWPAAS